MQDCPKASEGIYEECQGMMGVSVQEFFMGLCPKTQAVFSVWVISQNMVSQQT